MNSYENLQIVRSQFYTDQMSIGLLVFRFDANKNKQRAIWLHLTIHNIWSPTR